MSYNVITWLVKSQVGGMEIQREAAEVCHGDNDAHPRRLTMMKDFMHGLG